jgi:hypothetical protein
MQDNNYKHIVPGRRIARTRTSRRRGWKPSAFLLVLVLSLVHPQVCEGRKTRITWVNGIAHNLEHMVEGQHAISQYFGGKAIIFCHNPTAMVSDGDVRGYLSDLGQAGQQKLLGRITGEVDGLVLHLRRALADVGRRGCVVHIAHSQGALITQLALPRLRADEMERLEVLAFGGAAVLHKTPATPFRRCINYYAANDPLLVVVPSASQALRSGLVQEEFCFLAPRAGDPIRDHNLWGPTYGQALQWEGERFQRLHVHPLYRVARSALRAFLALSRILVLHLLQCCWVLLVRPFLHCCALVHRGTHAAWETIRHGLVHHVFRPLWIVCTLLMDWMTSLWRTQWRGEAERYQLVTAPPPSPSSKKKQEKEKTNTAAAVVVASS